MLPWRCPKCKWWSEVDTRWEWSCKVRILTQGGNGHARWECPHKVGNGPAMWMWGENVHTRWKCPCKLGNSHMRWTQGENGHTRWEYPCKVGNDWTRWTQGENAHMRWEMVVVGQWITKVVWSFGSRRGLLAYVYSGVFVWMNECLSGEKVALI